MYGGQISADNYGNISGDNATGRADAAFLNALGIKWERDGNPSPEKASVAGEKKAAKKAAKKAVNRPDLTALYSSPDRNDIGFNMSLNDAINRTSLSEQTLIALLDRIIQTRGSDAKKHYFKGSVVHDGHAYIYGATKFLVEHYIPRLHPGESYFPPIKPGERKRLINIYKNEFINLYEQENAPVHVPHSERSPVRKQWDGDNSTRGSAHSRANSSTRGRAHSRANSSTRGRAHSRANSSTRGRAHSRANSRPHSSRSTSNKGKGNSSTRRRGRSNENPRKK
jgi:hypothetical protein